MVLEMELNGKALVPENSVGVGEGCYLFFDTVTKSGVYSTAKWARVDSGFAEIRLASMLKSNRI
jgi:hypothetical protein